MPFQIVSNLNPVVVNMSGGFVGSITGNTAGVPAVVSSGTMYLAGGNNVTLSQNGNTISINGGAGGGGGGIANAAGTQTATSGTVVYSNSNNVSFGMSNSSVITASASFNQTAQTQNLHNVSLSGNTAGVMAQVSSGTMTLAGGNNITLSQNGNAVTISGPNTVAQTQFVLSNSNGISFGTNGSTVTATVATNYQSQGAYLTTAMQSASSSVFAKTGFTTASTAGSDIVGTHDTNGLSIGIPKYLTTAQPVGAYLTTARASTDAIGLNTAQSNVTWTANSSGLSIDARGYAGTNTTFNGANISGSITQNSNGLNLSLSVAPGGGGADGYNIIGVNGAGTSASTTLQLSNSNNVSFGLNAGTITATASFNQTVQTQGMVSVNGSTGNISFATGSSLSSSSNGSTITFGLASNITTALQSANANYLTSQSNQAFSASGGSTTFQTLNFANSNGITFSNSNGSVIASHNGLTTAMASNRGTDFVQANAAFAGTNASGTIASNGISVSVAAPGAAAENNNHELAGNTAGNSTASGSTIQFIGGNNITLSGTNGSQIRIDAGGGGGGVTYSRYNEFKESPMVAGEIGNGSLHIQPWLVPNLYMDRVVLHKAFSNASNSSFSFTVSDWVGIYTLNASTLSLLHSASISTNFSGSGTAGSYLSYGGGIKAQTLGLTQTLTDGMYWIGVIQRTTTGGGAGHTLNQVLNSQMNSTYRGLMGAATNATNQMSTGFGVYSATTSAMPNSVAITQINGNSSVFLRPPSIYFVSGTI